MIIVTYNYTNILFDNLQISCPGDGQLAYECICKFNSLQYDLIYLQTYTRILSYLIMGTLLELGKYFYLGIIIVALHMFFFTDF